MKPLQVKTINFQATKKDSNENNHLKDEQGNIYATEVYYDIYAENIERAIELLNEQGENSDEFDITEIGVNKDQMGNYFPESIEDVRDNNF